MAKGRLHAGAEAGKHRINAGHRFAQAVARLEVDNARLGVPEPRESLGRAANRSHLVPATEKCVHHLTSQRSGCTRDHHSHRLTLRAFSTDLQSKSQPFVQHSLV
jgi:hypothetical protein